MLAHAREGAFSLVELLVAMIIVVLLTAVVIPTFMGTKQSAREKAVASVAVRYADAVESFRLDHNGRTPEFSIPGKPSEDWEVVTLSDSDTTGSHGKTLDPRGPSKVKLLTTSPTSYYLGKDIPDDARGSDGDNPARDAKVRLIPHASGSYVETDEHFSASDVEYGVVRYYHLGPSRYALVAETLKRGQHDKWVCYVASRGTEDFLATFEGGIPRCT